MLCPRCGSQEVTPGTGLCVICATDALGEDRPASQVDLIEKDPLEFMRQAMPPANLYQHEAVRKRLAVALGDHPDVYEVKPLIRAWCDSKGHAADDGEVIEGGEAGWKQWLTRKVPSDPKAPEVEPDLDAGRELATEPNVLDLFADDVKAEGLVGERGMVKLLGLSMTSRHLDRPVSVVVKGLSGSGKSEATRRVMAFFPRGAYRDISGGSPLSLAYSQESYAHRMVLLFEASALEQDHGIFVYLMRSLLSEDRIRYEVTRGPGTVTIDKSGPTGLITTTVLPRLESQLETRLMSVYTDVSEEQTRRIVLAQAERATGAGTSSGRLAAWHGFHTIVAESEHRVVLPFARALAALVDVRDVGVRRSFPAHLGLFQAHAILHQRHREKDLAGRIVATEEDYAAVRDIVAEVTATSRKATVTADMAETLDAIGEGLTLRELETRLGLTQPTVSRRVTRLAEARLVAKSRVGKAIHVTAVMDDGAGGLPPAWKLS